MDFTPYRLRPSIVIHNIYTCYYFELSRQERYPAESHDFWEIVYVDKGEVNANTGSGYYRLNQGDILVHSPNEFHQLESTGNKAPNLFIVTFHCENEEMRFFDGRKQFRLANFEHALLARLMKEGLNAFGPQLLDYTRTSLASRQESPFGSEQLFQTYLEQLLIYIIRNYGDSDRQPAPLIASTTENQTDRLSRQIIAYIEQNLSRKVSLADICTHFGMGKTQVNILFKRVAGTGIVAFMNRAKIEQAKKYIREEMYNLTEISELLGYSSIHYFSRHFKKEVGMTPTEYSKTIKSRSSATP